SSRWRSSSARTNEAAMNVIFRVWRQRDPKDAGGFVRYPVDGLSPEMTLLAALDRLNETLVGHGEPPVAFDSDCREGICGACGIVVDGRPHGPLPCTTTCLVPMRAFRDGATITLEPFRTGAFPVVRDLMVDRRALDRVMQAGGAVFRRGGEGPRGARDGVSRGGGYVSVRAGSAPEANTLPIAREAVERALDAAECIGCGACVAAGPHGPAGA